MQCNNDPVSSPKISIINSFPNPTAVKYNEDLWHKQHGNNIVIINCVATDIHYPEHWSPLSIKCAFGGREFYHFGNRALAVEDSNFLILNEGAVYSSSIESKKPTESFTLNFTGQNIREVFASMVSGKAAQLDNPFDHSPGAPAFVEKLYPHNEYLSHILLKIRKMVRENEQDDQLYLELLYTTLENMTLLYNNTCLEIKNYGAARRSTNEEMYKRLNLAKDYMDSCFSENISLHHLSRICFLNPHYLLRQFRKFYNITPHQYLMNRRLRETEQLLLKTDTPITELAKMVGFFDLSSFSKLFKRYSGLSPEKFRVKNRC